MRRVRRKLPTYFQGGASQEGLRRPAGQRTCAHFRILQQKNKPPGAREIVARIEDFRQGLVPLAVPLALLRRHVVRFNLDYIAGQSYLNPRLTELTLRSQL